ncbi:S-adenosyl-L-methionine-dependent methyltransferase [Acephala macrosclerotiorum]|nr:S-adenosyl-L-methionine-dependent methyltransferase [Acephala macrosclerotiorum]
MPPKRVTIDPNAIDPEAKNYRYQPGESVAESILSFRKAMGRYFEAEKKQEYDIRGYPYPNGEPKSDCLDIQHAQLLLSFSNRLYLSPIPKEKLLNVMDFGTGTGIWAIDFAIEHPGANVLGVDSEPFRLNHTRENLYFQTFVFDPERAWKPDCKYDLIHNRVMFGSLEEAPAFIQQAFECLATGGYLEMVSFTYPILLNDGAWPDDCKLKLWSQMLEQAGFGLHPNPAKMYENQMTRAGFKDIKVKRFKWPSSPWPRDEYLKKLGY